MLTEIQNERKDQMYKNAFTEINRSVYKIMSVPGVPQLHSFMCNSKSLYYGGDII